MGCSNARLLVQTPLSEGNNATPLNANNSVNPLSLPANETSPPVVVSSDANNSSTRMHLTGVDLVVERNGSYTLLLTPKTHKQLMPYVLRKKRFRILVDKPRIEGISIAGNPPLASYDLPNSERIMESGKELKLTGKKGKKQNKQKMESTIETVQQVASDELDKAKARFVGGRSIDRGNPEDNDENIQSDDEGMIEEIVTTVEEDKDLECKVKKKIETKKTVEQDPDTHNKITKVVKTEVTEITRTITINDQHDLERAKRELGIDDVNKLLPSTQIIYNVPSTYHTTSSWIDHPRLTHVQEKYYEPSNEIVTSGDFPSDSPIKQHSPNKDIFEHDQPLAEATTVGRGPVVETISSSSIVPQSSSTPPPSTTTTAAAVTDEQKPIETKKKKKKSSLNLCSCTRSTTNDIDEEQRKQKAATIIEQKSKQKKKASVTTANAVLTSTNLQSDPLIKSSADTQIQGQQLISDDIKQLIVDKKSLLIDYIHSKIFLPSKLFTTKEQDSKGKKVSSRIFDLLRYDRCSSWTNLFDQLKDEYSDQLPANIFLQPMVKTYEDLFTTKQSNLLNTFSTIHNEKDLKNIPENNDYITIVQTYINERDNQPNIGVITKPLVENIEDSLQRLQQHVQSDKKVIDDDHEKQQALIHQKEIDMTDDIDKNLPVYNEDQLNKVLADVSPHKPITLAEAIAYQYIDLEDPKLGLSNDTVQRIKSLFRPLSLDDESTLNLIRIKRAGQYLADFNLAETHAFEKFNLSEPFIYQLQQSFEPTLDFNEKQFRSLTDAILNNKDEYSKLQFDIGRTLIPADDLKESSTNDFSQSDSGYSMTTATYESLAGKVKSEFETITEPISDQLSESEKTIGQTKLSDDIHLDTTHSDEKLLETVQQTTENLEKKKDSAQITSEPIVKKEDRPATPVYIKKRKSTGLLSCFGNKKAKASTDQHGKPTVTPSSAGVTQQTTVLQTTNSIQEKPTIDYAILPDGKRIYIDSFRDRPGLDMSYKPNDFDTQYVLPVAKPVDESERSITPENTELQLTTTETIEEHPIVHLEPRPPTIEPVDVQAEVVEEKPRVHLEPRSPTIEPVDVQAEVVEEKPRIHLEPRAPTIEPVDVHADVVEEKPHIHLEPRGPTIEPVDVQLDSSQIVIPLTKKEESTVTKTPSSPTTTPTTTNLHGAGVDLPEIELVKPGPLPTLTLTKEKHKKPKEAITTEKTSKIEKTPKIKKSTGGLCASCFGAKAAEKKKKEITSETVKAPIEQKKVVEQEEEKKDDVTPTTILTTPTIESSPLPILSSTTNETTTLPKVNIDIYRERTFQQTTEELPKLDDRLGATLENLVVTEEPHYQLPSSEPVPPIPLENEYSLPDPNTYDIPRTTETPSVENIQIDTEEKILNNEITLPPPEITEIQKSSADIILTEPKIESTITTEIETMPNVEVKDSTTKGSYTLPTTTTTTKTKKVKEPKVKEPKVKEPKVKEPKVKEPKVKEHKVKEPKVKEPKVEGDKKSGLFSSMLCHSKRKSKAPALDLPAVERDLSPNNPLREPHRHDSDPLRIPNTDLPQPDLPLPTYDRPEVDMTNGQTKQSSEFSIPIVDLPPIPDLQLPHNDQKHIDLTTDEMKVPNVTLPDVQFTSNEQESVKLPELNLKTEKSTSPEVSVATKIAEKLPELPLLTEIKQEKEVEHLPTLEAGLALASPVDDILATQVDHQNFPIETDYAIKIDSTIPDLPKLPADEIELPIKPELLSNEQKYTITDTHFVQPPELPTLVDKQTTENLESPPKLPDFSFELPSLEPVSILSKDTTASPPSFDDDVPTVTSTIVPAIEISTPPIKSTEKEVIGPKSDIKKKSSTLALCSCFGNKSNAQKDKPKSIVAAKEKSKTIAAPKADLPEVDLPVPSSNVSSTLKTKGSLRAPSSDLPPVDLSLPASESVRLPAIHVHEKKRQAPKKPKVKEEKVVPQVTTTSPEAVVPVTPTTTTVNEVETQKTDTVPTIEIQSEEEALLGQTSVQEEINTSSSTPLPVLVEKQVEGPIEIRPPTPTPIIQAQPIEEIKVESTPPLEKQSTEETKETSTEPKKSSSFEIKAPALNIPELNISPPSKSDGYTSSLKHDESTLTTTTTQSRSDSGLEAILSSHLHPSSTFSTTQTIEGLNQHQSISSGLGSATTDSITTTTLPDIKKEKRTTEPKRENSLLRHDFTRKISMNDDLRAKLIYRQPELKKCLEAEISKSIEDFDPKKDQKSLDKILTHGIDLIKDKKVTTYPELKQKLIVEHKNDAFIVDPVVRSLYCTIEKQGLDNLDKPEFPIAIRDMVRLPAKQAFDTVTQLNKEKTEEPPRIVPEPSSTRSCLTCGRTKSKPKVPSTPISSNTGLLDERRRLQLNTHRNELGNILRDHIQSSQPPIRQFNEHPKEADKILRKSLTLVTQPKILSYEQIRNDLKTEYKQTFYLVDPTVDIIRDTFDHCDITQMNEKTNLDILDSNISQTANLYNQINNQTNLLTTEEYNLLKSNQLTWLNQHLIDNELKEKKITKKQNKELSKILTRTFELLSLNLTSTWDELNSQLYREFPKAHNLCGRSIELTKQAQKDGLLLLQQSPNSTQQDVTAINIINVNGKRRPSSLITDRARQNLKTNRKKILSSITSLLFEYNKPLYTEHQIETYVNKTLHHLEEQKSGQFKTYNDLKEKLKKDFKHNHEKLIEQIVDVIEQVHATNQFDDLDKPEVQTLMRDRLDGKPLVLKEMYVSLPPRVGAYGTSKHDESSRYLSTSINGDQTFNSSSSSHRVGRGLSWREANERARILFYRGKHPAIHYDEQAAAFDVRMLLETTTGGTQEIPVTDSDVHELLNSCGVQWDGVNIISLVDHSEDVVRAAEQAALKVIREKGLVDLRTPPATRNTDDNDEPLSSS